MSIKIIDASSKKSKKEISKIVKSTVNDLIKYILFEDNTKSNRRKFQRAIKNILELKLGKYHSLKIIDRTDEYNNMSNISFEIFIKLDKEEFLTIKAEVKTTAAPFEEIINKR